MISSGDIVSVQEAAGRSRKGESSTTTTTTGVVYRVHEGKIILAFKDELPEDLKDRCSIYKMANEVTYERMKKAMDLLEKFANDGTANSMPILQTLFSKKSVPSFSPSRQVVEYYDDSLNPSQREAVEFALSAREVALIHGPPGTGKTHTCVELIRQLVKRGERVLVCGPSNISVDNLVDRLSKTKLDIVRVGHRKN